MKILLILLLFEFAVTIRVDGQTAPDALGQTVETIVCIRHGEYPTNQLGQLTCRGLNRALALPKVLLAKYGPPQFIFAPNPTQKVLGYYYVRPLTTIEPTAIRCRLPVDTQFGYRQIKDLEQELRKQKYQTSTIFIAWEHAELDKFVKNLLKSNGGDPAIVPPWPSNDCDTIFLVKIIHSKNGESVAFKIDHEGLNNLSDICP